jgi:hypothetical protein
MENEMISQTELDILRRMEEVSMNDTCIILVPTSGSGNSYGEPDLTWTSGSPTICGMQNNGGKEQYQGSIITLPSDFTLRLPHDTSIDKKYRVTITHRFGEPVTNITYEVISTPRLNASCIRVDLRKVDV